MYTQCSSGNLASLEINTYPGKSRENTQNKKTRIERALLSIFLKKSCLKHLANAQIPNCIVELLNLAFILDYWKICLNIHYTSPDAVPCQLIADYKV